MDCDTRYICNCYDIMENISASRNYTGLGINRGLTFGEYKHGDLGIRGSRYFSILGTVDSKQIVKNIFTPQKYISWSYFLNLYSKSKQTSWNKSFLIMVRKKCCKDTHIELKKLLHCDKKK